MEISKPNGLIYCDKKIGSGRCGELAAFIIDATHKRNLKPKKACRCKDHIYTSTATTKLTAGSAIPLDQAEKLKEVNVWLNQFIGKAIPNNMHKGTITGKYIKPNGGIMCQNSGGVWKFLYYHQITISPYGKSN